MKNILKSTALALLLIFGASCENDDQTIITASGGPELLTPLNGAEYILNPATPNAEVTTLVWNHADYSEQTEINYEVQVALSGTDFATITNAGMTTSRFVTWSVEALNTVALDAGLTPYLAGELDVRIKSSLGSNSSLEGYSNVIKIKVTPYTLDLPTLAVPGNHQGWDPSTAPLLASSGFGETDFEGYVWLDGDFNFLRPKADGTFDWDGDAADWGDDGSFSGVLLNLGESNCVVSTAGYYFVKANTKTTGVGALTYSTTPISWGIIGYATTGDDSGWNQDVDLTYNPTTKKLELASIFLSPGAFKFRGNNAWSNGFDFGTLDADGLLISGGDLTFSGTAGNYKVILDLSNPRQYTYELIAL